MTPQHPELVMVCALAATVIAGLLLWFALSVASAPYRMSAEERAYIARAIEEDNLQYDPPSQWSEDCPVDRRTRWDVETQSFARVSDEN